ncbi:GGDEF domain-containing protein [Cohnella pontilimi]|uniref:GGDEF domain-containing protein n=1 Tax=Cohnella pontilimi TaxID=2564100 RepID=A0A4U0F9J2_9BACL|nr:GGDEF domain-containing protein [Cohnella pontilimi]TJY41367.1 GGDEF domain-containing protein [Cohnella pontilimi]
MPSFAVSGYNAGLLFSSSISVVVLGLMLFMSVRLYAGNRKRAYRNLLISLAFIFIHHFLQLTLSIGLLPGASVLAFIGKLLQVSAFIVMNFAVFELYYRRRPRTRLWFFGLLLAAFLIAAGGALPGASAADAGLAERMRHTPVLDGYMLVLPLLFALMFGPHIGQRRKYMAGLLAAFLSQLFVFANKYGTSGWNFEIAAELMQVVYYVLIFMLLFERVVELLTSAYRSSITDGLTNLYNRRYFVGQLERALRSGKPVGVIFCDIDNFKRLNDTHGHHRADGVLKQVAGIIQEETQGSGLAGRYGGEELVAFVAGPALAGMQTAESIRARTEKETLVTLSIGLCVAMPGIGLGAEALLKRADQAMYQSKTTGKNRVTDYAELPDAGEIPFGPPARRGRSGAH